MKIIFSDIDGTLINNELVVTERTRNALMKVVAQGHLFVPVSARMPEAIKPIINEFLPETPIISYNGALVQSEDGNVIDSQAMSVAEVIDVCNFLKEKFHNVVWNIYSGNLWFSQDRSNYWISREEKVVGIDSEEVPLSTISELQEVHKMLLMGEEDDIIALEKELKQINPTLSISRSFPNYIEVMAEGIDKGRAVTLFAKHYGIPMSDTIGFGDNFNDIEMLKIVGKGYVMANGPEAVKVAVGRVTSDHNNDGIAEILEVL